MPRGERTPGDPTLAEAESKRTLMGMCMAWRWQWGRSGPYLNRELAPGHGGGEAPWDSGA